MRSSAILIPSPKIAPFDTNARRYERWFDEHPQAYSAGLEAVGRLLPRFTSAIEIGVGSGRFAVPLGIRFGVDPSRAMSRLAKERGVEVLQCVAEALPFPDCLFDVALMVTTICFLEDIDRSFEQTYRILRKGGAFLAAFVDRDSALGSEYQKLKSRNVFYTAARFYSPAEVQAALRRSGFRRFEYCQTLFHPVAEVDKNEPVEGGYGAGSFVVVRCMKPA
jgi:SAM-dependent methyltransferase